MNKNFWVKQEGKINCWMEKVFIVVVDLGGKNSFLLFLFSFCWIGIVTVFFSNCSDRWF